MNVNKKVVGRVLLKTLAQMLAGLIILMVGISILVIPPFGLIYFLIEMSVFDEKFTSSIGLLFVAVWFIILMSFVYLFKENWTYRDL